MYCNTASTFLSTANQLHDISMRCAYTNGLCCRQCLITSASTYQNYSHSSQPLRTVHEDCMLVSSALNTQAQKPTCVAHI